MNKAGLVENPWLRANDIGDAHLNPALVEASLKLAHRGPLAFIQKALIRLRDYTTGCLDPNVRLLR